jgi:uncharacterized protein YyaL (SSP411 family)
MREIELAKDWLLNSGIQNLDGEHKGAFNSWFDVNKKNYPYAYSEITGYAISTLIYLYDLTKEEVFLERGKMAADWLMNKATHNSGGILCRFFYEEKEFMGSFENEEMFLFDSGMVLNGITNLYEITKENKYLEFSKRLVDFMIGKQKQDGSFYAIYDAKNDKLTDSGDKWSTQSGAFHNKLTIGLLKLYKITKDERYKDSAIRICNYSLKFFKEDGRIINFSKTGDSLFHPHCYAAEGLYVAGKYLNNKKYLELSRKATDYLFTIQKQNGGIPQMFKESKLVEFERSDILGQALRIGVLHSIEHSKLERLYKRLLEFQNLNEEQKGGFRYGYDDQGKKYYHINSWCTMFALQAMILYKQRLDFNGFFLV